MEEKIIELETRLTYAENAVDELNRTIAGQNKEIESLRKFCAELKKKLDEIYESGSAGAVESRRPPHY